MRPKKGWILNGSWIIQSGFYGKQHCFRLTPFRKRWFNRQEQLPRKSAFWWRRFSAGIRCVFPGKVTKSGRGFGGKRRRRWIQGFHSGKTENHTLLFSAERCDFNKKREKRGRKKGDVLWTVFIIQDNYEQIFRLLWTECEFLHSRPAAGAVFARAEKSFLTSGRNDGKLSLIKRARSGLARRGWLQSGGKALIKR